MNFARFFERRYDTARLDANRAEYEQRRGYQRYHDLCRQRCTVTVAEGPLRCDGMVFFPRLLAPAEAAGLRRDIEQQGDYGLLKGNARDLFGFRLDNREFVRALLGAVLTPRVEDSVRQCFGSEFLVHWYMAAATAASNTPPSVSFLWHCDKGPSSHLKLIVGLNDFAEHGGGTAFLDRADSRAVAETGYLFGQARRRTPSLDELGARAGRALRAIAWHPRAGDAVLFQPTSVVHTGLTPTSGTRHTLTLCLLPSPVSWQTAFDRGTLADLRHDPLWHEDAAGLLAQLGGMAPHAQATG